MFSVADTFDALTTDRPYRPGMEIGPARAIIDEASGTQFDPAAVEAFHNVSDDELRRIAEEIA